MLISSRTNPVIKKFRALRERGSREGLCVLEGVKLVEEGLAAGIELVEAAAAPRLRATARGKAALAALEGASVPVRDVTDDVLRSLSDVEQDQGIVAIARCRTFQEDAMFTGTPLVLVAAGIQNPGNVGALLRTAEAAGATGAMLAGCADPWSWKSLRGSMGSAFRLPHSRPTGDVAALVGRLRRRGLAVYAAAAGKQAVGYTGADFRQPCALVVGNEGAGLEPAVVEAATAPVSIPMAGKVESLNVGVAAGVLLFEAARQRRGETVASARKVRG